MYFTTEINFTLVLCNYLKLIIPLLTSKVLERIALLSTLGISMVVVLTIHDRLVAYVAEVLLAFGASEPVGSSCLPIDFSAACLWA